jgi:hypothetical protein
MGSSVEDIRRSHEVITSYDKTFIWIYYVRHLLLRDQSLPLVICITPHFWVDSHNYISGPNRNIAAPLTVEYISILFINANPINRCISKLHHVLHELISSSVLSHCKESQHLIVVNAFVVNTEVLECDGIVRAG